MRLRIFAAAAFGALAVFALPVAPCRAQRPRRPSGTPAAARDTTLPTGTWRGTSLCLMGKPVCKDEVVVYHITADQGAEAAASGDSVTIVANKVVAGREENMGTLRCRFARDTGTVVCAMPPQFPPGEWRFVRRGGVLSGGLTLADGRRVRAVRVARVARVAGGR